MQIFVKDDWVQSASSRSALIYRASIAIVKYASAFFIIQENFKAFGFKGKVVFFETQICYLLHVIVQQEHFCIKGTSYAMIFLADVLQANARLLNQTSLSLKANIEDKFIVFSTGLPLFSPVQFVDSVRAGELASIIRNHMYVFDAPLSQRIEFRLRGLDVFIGLYTPSDANRAFGVSLDDVLGARAPCEQGIADLD